MDTHSPKLSYLHNLKAMLVTYLRVVFSGKLTSNYLYYTLPVSCCNPNSLFKPLRNVRPMRQCRSWTCKWPPYHLYYTDTHCTSLCCMLKRGLGINNYFNQVYWVQFTPEFYRLSNLEVPEVLLDLLFFQPFCAYRNSYTVCGDAEVFVRFGFFVLHFLGSLL